MPSENSLPNRPLLLSQKLPNPQQQRSRQKQEALYQAALQRFAERGFEATTIEDIAQLAGVAVGGFYQRFDSKKQILLALMERLLDEFEAVEMGIDPSQPLRAELRQLMRKVITLDRHYVGAYRAWREVILTDRDLKVLNTQINAWVTARTLLSLQALIQLPNARLDVDLPTISWMLTLLFWELILHIDERNIEAVTDSTGDMLYHWLFTDYG